MYNVNVYSKKMITKRIKSIFRTTKFYLNQIFWASKSPITPSLTIFNFSAAQHYSIQYEMSFHKDNKQYSIRLKKIKFYFYLIPNYEIPIEMLYILILVYFD